MSLPPLLQEIVDLYDSLEVKPVAPNENSSVCSRCHDDISAIRYKQDDASWFCSDTCQQQAEEVQEDALPMEMISLLTVPQPSLEGEPNA